MDLDFYTLIKIFAAQLLMPIPLCLGFFILGILLGVKKSLGRLLCAASMLSLVLFSWAPVADGLLSGFESKYPPLREWPADASPVAVVVLGAGYQPNQPWALTGQLSDSAVNRLAEGIRLWRLSPSVRLVVSGRDRRPEIPPMALGYAELAGQLGVPQNSVWPLREPRDTGEEAKAAVALLGKGAELVLVTSASHMPRAVEHFREAGLNPIPAPTHYLSLRDDRNTLNYWIPSARHLRKSERAFYEGLGLLASKWE